MSDGNADRPAVSGWATTADGQHVTLSPEDAAAIWDAAKRSEAEQAERMPTATDALRLLCDAKDRLRRLGWRDGSYCPKDGTEFAAVEYGSSGIFTGLYHGKCPDGFAMIEDSITCTRMASCGSPSPI